MSNETSQKDPPQMDITELSGIGSSTAKKLKSSGYGDMMGLATANALELSEVADLGDKTAKNAIHEARKKLDMNFMSGTDFAERRDEVEHITTGSSNVDDLLNGGIETQAITECYGPYGSGKSQFAFQLAVTAQLPKDEGGLDQKVIWLDTEGTFRTERIKQISRSYDMDPKKVLDNIKVARAYSSDHQVLLTDKIPNIIEEGEDIGLIIVDSLIALFRHEFAGRGSLADRQQKLNKHVHTLQRLADRYNIAIYVTNQVMAKPDVYFGDPTEAVGGHIVGHASTYRLYLRNSKGDKRIARLVDSPCLPEGEAVFKITGEGIEDAE